MTTRVYLRAGMFEAKKRVLVEADGLTAHVWRYDSGVAALELINKHGSVTLLPFHGQQIWRAHFAGRELTMHSAFAEPRNTQVYLENYGGFLLHCGATAMGVPTAEDNHPLHGELPNAPYQTAFVDIGEDAHGQYMALGGQYQHTIAFGSNYLAQPTVKLYADRSLLHVSLVVENLNHTPMELMYMAHINFRPVDHARLLSSAQGMRVRRSIPSHVTPSDEYLAFLDKLERDPTVHEVLDPALSFDPEVVFYLDYHADADGWAHTLQHHPDGTADYVRHRPAELPKGVRWICRTANKQALGMVLPATAEPEGYSAEKAKGNIVVLPAEGRFETSFAMGAVDAAEAERLANHIADIVG